MKQRKENEFGCACVRKESNEIYGQYPKKVAFFPSYTMTEDLKCWGSLSRGFVRR